MVTSAGVMTGGQWAITAEGAARQRASSELSREQVIDRILSINTTATQDFLSRFGRSELASYLDHLMTAQGPRGPLSRWERPGDSPAIMMEEVED